VGQVKPEILAEHNVAKPELCHVAMDEKVQMLGGNLKIQSQKEVVTKISFKIQLLYLGNPKMVISK
jgi:hypothetical protein